MKRVVILGMGPGAAALATVAAREELAGADVAIGSKRLLEALPSQGAPSDRRALVAADDIVRTVLALPEQTRAVLLMSGDTGLYSGARAVLDRLQGHEDIDLVCLPGVSSLSYLSAKLMRPWQGWRVASAHGTACNPVALAREALGKGALPAGDRGLFLLTDATHSPAALCGQLTQAGLGACAATVGERLSYPDERIVAGTVGQLTDEDFAQPCVLLIEPPRGTEGAFDVCPGKAGGENVGENSSENVGENSGENGSENGDENGSKTGDPWPYATPGVPDELFERSGVPMTKREVRAVALARLALAEGDVAWDVGAGTGSVSVEMGRLVGSGTVYAVERDREAADLTRTNIARFGLENVEVRLGSAPEALKGLPAPDAVFVGGSGGCLAAILQAVLAANPAARVCVPAVTVETLIAATDLLTGEGWGGFTLCQVSVARAQEAGSSHLMRPLSPIWLACARGAGADEGGGRPWA